MKEFVGEKKPSILEFPFTYRISSIIGWSFSFQNNPKDLEPSCKMDLWDCRGRVKIGIKAKFHRTDLVI